MAIEDFGGKILGRDLVLLTRNATTDPAKAAEIAESLITQNHIAFMVGAIDSGVAAAMSAVCQKYGVIFINTNSSSPSEAVENAHRTKFVFDANGANFNKALLKYALDRHPRKRAILLTEDTSGAQQRGGLARLHRALRWQRGRGGRRARLAARSGGACRAHRPPWTSTSSP